MKVFRVGLFSALGECELVDIAVMLAQLFFAFGDALMAEMAGKILRRS